MARIEQAIILAGGEGQRLKPFTRLRPKVMIPVANKPILRYIVEALAESGIRHIVLVTGYRREEIQDYFGSGKKFGVDITYVVQNTQVGTADALKQAKNIAATRFLVLPGDNIISAETVHPLVDASVNTVIVRCQPNVSQYGIVMAKNGRVSGFIEKPEDALSYLVNTGIYALDHAIFPFIEQETDLPIALQTMVDTGYGLDVQETKATWLDAVYPIDILRLNESMLTHISSSTGGIVENNVVLKGKISIGNNSIIKSGSYVVGPAIIGENCEIGPGVCIFQGTSIGNNVSVYPFSQIKNCVVGNEVVIGSNCFFQDSIIASGCVFGHGITIRSQEIVRPEYGEGSAAKLGALIGDFCELEDNIVINAGISLGAKVRVKSMKVIYEDIPEGSLVY
jgi:UDP-N-acetylglucosamine diphosphorylase / glucose-1-phosphate thymidylyltransferase / UDP-N-acetylgalactosamine diphosphorylase / glucosamine-1-phosphate N-acetyltransferase / galactosamine-1-phosphate N-acetyltransferase